MAVSIPAHPSPDIRANFRHLSADIFWYGIVSGSILAFLSVYAARLGATTFQIGLLTAGPALANLFISLPAGRWLEGRSTIRIVYSSSIWQRAGYIPVIFLPWLLPAAGQVWALELIILLMAIPGTLLAISFNAMFAEVVPSRWRAGLVGRRNALLAVSITVTSLICARLLDAIVFPLNYQVVFVIGAASAALSSFHLGRIRGRPREMEEMERVPSLRKMERAKGGRPLLRLDLLRGPFGSFMLVYLLFYTFQYIPISIFPLAFVNTLGLSEGTISLGNALFYITMLLASTVLAPLSARLGHRRVVVVGALSYALYPLFIGLARGPALFYVASLTGGAVWALAGGGLINWLMERVPPDDVPAHMALHNVVLNLGALAGSLLGPGLGDSLGLRQAILVGAALRLVSGILFALKE